MLRTNFFKTVLASMLVVCATAFYSCDSDGEGPGDEGTTTESSIIGKWEVTDGGNTRAVGDAKYGSFEFTADNKYIITQPAVTTSGEKYMLVIFGDYAVGNNESNDLTLNLKEFGTIKISINKTSASITIDGVVYVAVKATGMDLTDNTKKLIGTWKLDKSYDLWTDSSGKQEETTPGNGETITFTDNGTYMFYDPNITEEDMKEGLPQYDYGTWKWVTSDIIEITYTWYEWSSSSVAPGEEPKEPEVTTGIGTSRYTVTELTDNKFTMDVIASFEPDYYEPDDKSTMWFSK